MRPHTWALLVGLLPLQFSCADRFPSTLVTSGYDDKEMAEAIQRARGRVDWFILQTENRAGSEFAVKAKITDGEKNEHFWLSDISYRDGVFEGLISNEPGMVHNVKRGQRWKVGRDEISDWMFLKDGKIHGNYTLRPLLKTMAPAEAAKYREALAEP